MTIEAVSPLASSGAFGESYKGVRSPPIKFIETDKTAHTDYNKLTYEGNSSKDTAPELFVIAPNAPITGLSPPGSAREKIGTTPVHYNPNLPGYRDVGKILDLNM